MKTHLDLFSGLGGFSLAAQANGFQTVAFCEVDPYAQAILKERFGAVLTYSGDKGLSRSGREPQPEGAQQQPSNGYPKAPRLHPDIFTLSGHDYAGVTLITGGCPCQPASCAGKRGGASDDRWLWDQAVRITDEAKPTYAIFENPPGIISVELGNYAFDVECLDRAISFGLENEGDSWSEIEGHRLLGLHSIAQEFKAIGYEVQPVVIPACAVDARHRRDRVWIVAHNEKRGRSLLRAEESRNSQSGDYSGRSQATTQDRGRGCSDPIPHTRRELLQGWRGESEKRATKRQPEPSFCRVADGLSERLDGGFQWPEEDPETPRVATGVPYRNARLKTLGNTIVWQVAAEIIRCMEVDLPSPQA